MTPNYIFVLLSIGLLAGILSGFIGIGGGVIMVPMLVFLGFSQHQAQGTSLAVMLPPVTFLAVMNYYKAGFINWKYALIISTMFILGGYLGSKLSLNINPKLMRQIFGVILLISALKMIFKK